MLAVVQLRCLNSKRRILVEIAAVPHLGHVANTRALAASMNADRRIGSRSVASLAFSKATARSGRWHQRAAAAQVGLF